MTTVVSNELRPVLLAASAETMTALEARSPFVSTTELLVQFLCAATAEMATEDMASAFGISLAAAAHIEAMLVVKMVAPEFSAEAVR